LRIKRSFRCKSFFKLIHAYGLLIPEQHAVGINRKIDDLGVLLDRLCRSLWEIDFDGMAEQRRRDDEYHQQDQHYVNKRHHIDLGDRMAAPTTVIEAAERHLLTFGCGNRHTARLAGRFMYLLARGQESEEVVRKGIQARQVNAVATYKTVIGQYCRDRN